MFFAIQSLRDEAAVLSEQDLTTNPISILFATIWYIPRSRWLEEEAFYLVRALGPDAVTPEVRSLASKTEAEQWSRAVNGASKNRRFAKTKKGYYVLGPRVMEPGDIVCVLLGGKQSFCLRSMGESYLLVGECYVHGFMSGEAIEASNRRELIVQTFEIM